MKVSRCDQDVVIKSYYDLTDFVVCILSHRPTVTSSNSKLPFNFKLGTLDSLSHFVIFSTVNFMYKILSWLD